MSETKPFFLQQLRRTSRPAEALRSLNSAIKQQACWLQLHSTSMDITRIYFSINCNGLASTSVVVGLIQQVYL